MFSPGVWWSGLKLNRCGSFVQVLQMSAKATRTNSPFQEVNSRLSAIGATADVGPERHDTAVMLVRPSPAGMTGQKQSVRFH